MSASAAWIVCLADAQSDELKTNKNNMNLDEAAWFSMGSLLGQGTENQPKSVSGNYLTKLKKRKTSLLTWI